MSELMIRIGEEERILVEETENGVKHVKFILAEDLARCVRGSMEVKVSSGLLPEGCISYSENEAGERYVAMLYQRNRADVSYYQTAYPDFPLPRLAFGFHILEDGRIRGVRLGVVENSAFLKPSARMYRYPFSNVSGFSLCTGNNVMPRCKSLHALASVTRFILSMPNNNDYFRPEDNRKHMELRELFEHLKDKAPEYYYSDILLPMEGKTLEDFIEWK